MQVINLKLESNIKEEMLEAIYGTVERLEQKVDELSASPKNTEAESTPVSVSVDTSKLEKDILAMAVKEGEAIDKLVRLREAICIFTDLTKKEASKDEQRSKLLFDTINQVKQELNATSKNVQDKLHSMDNTPLKKVVDALRGFAVMAILLVHNLEHFIFPVYPESSPEWLSILDAGVFNAVFSLFAGKSYAIFALLFGFTFYIQSHNQQLKGKDFGYRFLWRLVLLAGFATLNAAFFPAGDVLLLFVVVGIILFIVRKWSDKAILITAILFSLQPIEWFHYIMSLFNPAYTLPDLNVGAMYSEVADYTKNGTFWEFLIGNVTLGQKASLFWAIGAGRFLQTAGLFLFGLYIGRKELFVTSESHLKFWTKALIIAAISFAPLYSLKEQIMQSDSSLIQQTVGTAFDMWQKFAFTIVLIASFILLYQKAKFQKTVSNLRFYGKMSLTNYITQSIMGAIIYFPFGFYLAPYCGYTLSLIIGIILFLLQVQFCKWWLSKHKQGPLETIWHKWTWLGAKK